MKLHSLVFILTLNLWHGAVSQEHQLLYAAPGIEFCKTEHKIFIKPGDDFELKCMGDVSAGIQIFTPHEDVPPEDKILIDNARFTEAAERTTTINEYEDASEKDEGVYTCLVMHGPNSDQQYSTATCMVVVKDLCAEATCHELETCVPNYEEGTASCVCEFDCSTAADAFDPFCTDTCELMWNKCHMQETTCVDKKPREVDYKGFCVEVVNPVINALSDVQYIEDNPGQPIVLNAGVVSDGTPLAQVSWTFYPAAGGEGKAVQFSRNIHNFILGEETAGRYEAKITHCKNEATAITNTYNVQVIDIPSTAPPTLAPTTPMITEGPDDLTTGSYPVCSIFPGGAIEAFSGVASYYDLACSHVLAADVLTGGTYLDPWFIYGTFDKHEGKLAMRAMAFYLGSTVFEIQRGWIVNLGGEKMKLKEGVAQDIPDSGCNIAFKELHLVLDCPNFIAYYDGVMSGHIKMKDGDAGKPMPFAKSLGSFGLCYDNQSGFRKNWQVGHTAGVCAVDTDAVACAPDDDNCAGLQQPNLFGGAPTETWGSCGNGATSSCNELYCDEDTPTNAQICALNQAKIISCALKYGDLDSADKSEMCPEDPCDWKKDVVSRGCPQDDLPFVC